ncbi:PH domain-containing protein [Lentibacillus sp. CBA3610]|uniref:PH domain-containing protein n=1 Tax=Lentibacillus sp. CBA3610 TaxID=2518176 RepID=UPI0015955850|nr:PH domain-containing protein [Lentibacillus sp. CBA3610]
MEKWKNSLLSPDESIIDEITATFEVKENFGITYKFGNMLATNKRLILYTKYPLIGQSETAIYHYEEIIRIDVVNSLFSFHNGVSVAVKLVNKGNTELFLETIKLFSNHAPGIRNFQQSS